MVLLPRREAMGTETGMFSAALQITKWERILDS